VLTLVAMFCMAFDRHSHMTDVEREASTLGEEIEFEISDSDFAKEHRKTEDRQRAEEDESDVEQRVRSVIAANTTAPFPYSPKQIRIRAGRPMSDESGVERMVESVTLPVVAGEVLAGLVGRLDSATADEPATGSAALQAVISRPMATRPIRTDGFVVPWPSHRPGPAGCARSSTTDIGSSPTGVAPAFILPLCDSGHGRR
jgi:hypothetical protein